MPLHTCLRRTAPARRNQRGVSLLFALLTLVALMVSSLALVRSIDTGSLMVGNIGFKQDATMAADQATREAIAWMTTNKFSLNTDAAASGYLASNQEFAADGVTVLPPVDATGHQLASTAQRQLIDWDGNNCRGAMADSFSRCAIVPVDGADVGGNKVRYVIFRLCSKAGDYLTDTTIQCAKYTGTAVAGVTDQGDLSYVGRPEDIAEASPYFRVVVRVSGARNTTSFTETLVHF
jgi:type IV pilus assembly protein PilX